MRVIRTFLLLLLFSLDVVTAETPIIVATSYPVPEDAILVARDGNDSALGTLDAPLRSISQALKRVQPGGTIVIRQGTYREALPIMSKPFTMQPYPGEEVWIKGSTVVTDWVSEKGVWVHRNWVSPFCKDCIDPRILDPDHPFAGKPDQVFLNGAPLAQVGRLKNVKPGTFFVDHDRQRIVLGSDPTNALVEATIRDEALVLVRGADGSTIRGLGFAQFGPVARDGISGMVKGDAARLTFQNNTFADSAAVGLNVYGSEAKVVGNSFVRNGLAGFGAWRAHGLELRGNLFAHNNHERFVMRGDVAAAAGAKITQSRDIRVLENTVEHNHSNGLWLDINVRGAEIEQNIVRKNAENGIYFEISSHSVIVSNIVSENTRAGIVVSGAHDVSVIHNNIAANHIGFLLIDDDRINSDPEEVALGNDWITSDVRFLNNLIWRRDSSDIAIKVRDFSETRDADQMLAASGYNGHLAPSNSQGSLVEWWRGNRQSIFSDLDAFRASTGLAQKSVSFFGTPERFFNSPLAGDFTTQIVSPTNRMGLALPHKAGMPKNRRIFAHPVLGATLAP